MRACEYTRSFFFESGFSGHAIFRVDPAHDDLRCPPARSRPSPTPVEHRPVPRVLRVFADTDYEDDEDELTFWRRPSYASSHLLNGFVCRFEGFGYGVQEPEIAERMAAVAKSLLFIYDGTGGEDLNGAAYSNLWTPATRIPVDLSSIMDGAPAHFSDYYRKLEGCEWRVWHVRSRHVAGYLLRIMQKVGGNSEVSFAVHIQIVRED